MSAFPLRVYRTRRQVWPDGDGLETRPYIGESAQILEGYHVARNPLLKLRQSSEVLH